VLNVEPGGHGVLGPDDIRLIAGAGAAVRAARQAGTLAIIVTNRAQVAQGFGLGLA
jgi:histidinol phosphatase-like enzyme